ncbi:MAG TPA: hypothetical protein PK425_04005 [Syntrophales bacterium]|nr:hypothetical protein [Syntrophales bacterium]
MTFYLRKEWTERTQKHREIGVLFIAPAKRRDKRHAEFDPAPVHILAVEQELLPE